MLTKLEAVNQMLEAIGERPVSSLTSDSTDAELAEAILDETSRSVQAKGWRSNTDGEVELQPTVADRIQLPSNTLRCDPSGKDRWKNYRLRKNDGVWFMYDVTNKTYTIDTAVVCNVVYFFDYEDLTFPLQEYIAARASRVFQEKTLGSGTLDQFTVRREAEAYTALMDSEAEDDDTNVLLMSPHCRRVSQRNNRSWGN